MVWQLDGSVYVFLLMWFAGQCRLCQSLAVLGKSERCSTGGFEKIPGKRLEAVLCWRAGDIGDNLTPGGNADDVKNEFWGIEEGNEESYIEAAKKYALAIVDTCNKYNIDGFDYDIEDDGTLMSSTYPERANTFMRTLREEFNKTGKMLVADIPGGISWLRYYDILADDVIESLDYIVWQTYELGHSGLDNFFTGSNGVKDRHPEVFENVMRKSIITATFERAVDKHYFTEQQDYHPSCGIEHGGMGAYHIEYDYAVIRTIRLYVRPYRLKILLSRTKKKGIVI